MTKSDWCWYIEYYDDELLNFWKQVEDFRRFSNVMGKHESISWLFPDIIRRVCEGEWKEETRAWGRETMLSQLAMQSDPLDSRVSGKIYLKKCLPNESELWSSYIYSVQQEAMTHRIYILR